LDGGMKLEDARVCWRPETGEVWIVHVNRKNGLTVPDDCRYDLATGHIGHFDLLTKHGQKRRDAELLKRLGMLGMIQKLTCVENIPGEAVHCAFLIIDEYRQWNTPYGHSYEQWFGGEDPPGWKPPRR
jgi:hypothetical protein